MNNDYIPELEIVHPDKPKERDLGEEVNIQNGYSDDVYERCIIYPITNTTLH